MTYAKLMQKIVKLPGWIWEWKFGDLVYDIAYELTGIVIGIEDDVLNIVWDTGNTSDFQANHQTVPLPTVEQWMSLLRQKHHFDVIVGDSEFNNLHFARCENTRIVETVCHESDVIALAILFARVVLGYKWEDGEFVKC